MPPRRPPPTLSHRGSQRAEGEEDDDEEEDEEDEEEDEDEGGEVEEDEAETLPVSFENNVVGGWTFDKMRSCSWCVEADLPCVPAAKPDSKNCALCTKRRPGACDCCNYMGLMGPATNLRRSEADQNFRCSH